MQHTVLPALYCLPQEYAIVGIWSKTKKRIRLPDGTHIMTMTGIDTIALHDIDVIVLAATISSVPAILKTLLTHDVGHIDMFLDTPILKMKDVRMARYFSRFKHVYITEDYISMIQTEIIKNYIARGIVGRIKHIYLFHYGYKYHAVSFLKRITGDTYISFMHRKRTSDTISEVHITLSEGCRATIIEPRNYAIGTFLIVGATGTIANYQFADNTIVLTDMMNNNNIYIGTTAHTDTSNRYLVKNAHYLTIAGSVQDHTIMNGKKIASLITMFQTFAHGSEEFVYPDKDGLYDAIASAMLDRYQYFFDFRPPCLHLSLLQLIIHLACK